MKRTFKRKRASKVINFTSQSGFGKSLPFRGRKLGAKTWRSKLWNDTLAKPHYRSSAASSGAMTSNVDPTLGTVARLDAITTFWTAAGGAAIIDSGTTLPLFTGDIVIRGGKLGLRIYNESTGQPMNVKVWLTRDSRTPNYSSLVSPQPISFDMSLLTEFRKLFGTILLQKDYLLETNAQAEIEYRLRVQKIDQREWVDGRRYQWWIMVSDPDTTAGTAQCRLVSYFNMSFCADSIGTT